MLRTVGSVASRHLSKDLRQAYALTTRSTYSTQPEEIADDPNFFDMVGMYFERGARLVEDKLVETLYNQIDEKGPSTKTSSVDQSHRRVQGIFQMMRPCNHVLQVS